MIQFSVLDIQNKIEAQVANPEFASALLSSIKVTNLATLENATASDVAFYFAKHYQPELMSTRAGIIVIAPSMLEEVKQLAPASWKQAVFLSCERANMAMATLSGVFSKERSSHDHQDRKLSANKIHSTAVVDSSAKLGIGVEIGAYAIIEAGSEIGDQCVVYPHVYVGKKCSIGSGTVLFPHVTLYEKTVTGKNCRIHSGTVIGADGFGYVPVIDPVTKKPVNHKKIYHVGNVILGDEVEVGANTAIDRGTMGSTVVHSKTKIDNQVQIGHNCEIGEGSILCGGSGMAGSSSLGKFVTIAAGSGTANQVHVGDYSFVASLSGVMKSCEPGSELAGSPARPAGEFFRIMALQNKLLRDRNKDRNK